MFGDLFRIMSRISIEKGLESDYDITLETTHHGPVLQKPTLYVEIGSTEDRWSDRIAARVWAETITECIGLDGGNPILEGLRRCHGRLRRRPLCT